MKPVKQQDQSNLKWVADFIWNIADDRLRDVYVRGKYRDVILPFTVLRRLDAVLESTKQAVLERKKFLDTHKVAEQDGALRMRVQTAMSGYLMRRRNVGCTEDLSLKGAEFHFWLRSRQALYGVTNLVLARRYESQEKT